MKNTLKKRIFRKFLNMLYLKCSLLILFIINTINAQYITSGKIISENNSIIVNTLIINMTTSKSTVNRSDGTFSIMANIGDELRFIKPGYERVSKIISFDSFNNPIIVQLIKLPIEIQEIKLGISPSGNLTQDLKFFKKSKEKKLNEDIEEYIRTHPEEKKSDPLEKSPFNFPNTNQGQLNIIGFSNGKSGVIGAIISEIFKKDMRKLTFSEKHSFHNEIKKKFLDDFKKKGIDEFQFESYLMYLDTTYKFSDMFYGKNYSSIENKLNKHTLEYFYNKATIKQQ
ncbi:hypothetical protein [Cloacibacterium normanense]